MDRREFLRITAAWGTLTVLDGKFTTGIAGAKDMYPANRIIWISHTQPGSGYDIIPRAMAPYWTKCIKELVPGCKGGEMLVKNETAAAGKKAYNTIFRAEPDGYTIGGLDISFLTDMVTDKIEFDVTKYTYLARLDSSRKLVVTSKNGFKTWQEALDASKKATLKVAVGQFGRANHVAGIIMKEAINLNAKFIPTKSTAENMSMVIRGDAQVGVASEDSISNLLQTKEVRVLLTYDEDREYPGAASLEKMGHKDIGDYAAGQRFAIAPPGLPREITSLLIESLKKTLANREFQEWAKKSNFAFKPLYGDDALKLAKKYVQYYQGMEPTLKKYL
jgi:tripartite-type tricarboxylate transporter receptor subunit TctC